MSDEIDLHTTLGDDGKSLGVFLYAEGVDRRTRLKARLHDHGADYTSYPSGPTPPEINGSVIVTDGTLTLFAGPLYVVGPIEVMPFDLSDVKQAHIFVLDAPFNVEDRTRKTLIAATVPLEILERGGA